MRGDVLTTDRRPFRREWLQVPILQPRVHGSVNPILSAFLLGTQKS